MSSAGQAVGGVVGATIGFFIGGPVGALRGAQIGIMAGGLIDPPKGPTINGPRLDDLSVQTATYGAFIPRSYGIVAQQGNVFWLQGNALTEVKNTATSGGKGGPQQTTNTWSYYATFAVGLCKGPIDGVRRIWIGGQLWYDAGSDDLATIIASNQQASLFTLYPGSDTQNPDPLIQADKGVANVPAYRGLAYLVFDTLPLEKYGNSLVGAQVKVEVVKSATISYSVTPVGSVATGVTPFAMDLLGYRACVVNNGSSTLQLFDIANPADLRLLASATVTTNPVRVIMHGGYAYVLAYNTPLQVWNLGGDTLSMLGTAALAGAGVCLDVADQGSLPLAFVGTYPNTLSVYDMSVPTSPMLLGTATTGMLDATTNLSDLRYHQGYVYVACASGEVQVFDVSSPSAPALVGSYATGNTLACVRLVGDLAYAVSYGAINTLYVLDISTPASPALLGSVSTSGSCKSIAVEGDYVYAVGTNGNLLEMFDVSDPTAPALVATSAVDITPFDLRLSDGYIFHVSQYQTLNSSVFSGKKITAAAVLLSDIVQAECLTSSLLAAGDIDVTELTDSVRGYRVSQLGAIRSALDPLRAAWPFDVVQHGYQIKFKRRGSASVATIPASLLDARAAGDAPGIQITDSREMDLMLPRRVDVKYLDSVREYDVNEQLSPERTSTDAVGIRKLDLPIVFTAAEAAQKAETLLYLYWLERHDVSLRLPPIYAELEPGDVITVTSDAADYELRLTSTNTLPDGRIECAAKYNKAAIYSAVARGEEGQSTGALLTLDGPAVYSLLDIPLLRDDDDTAGFPVAMAGYLAGWPGGVLYRSDDGGQTWADLRAFTPGAVLGYATGTLAAHGGTVIDFASTLAVRLYSSSMALASITHEQMFAGQNWFAYGAHGRWEIIAAANAVLQGDGSYVLSDFLRGQRGTEWATGLHQASDRIVLLDANALAFVSVNSSTIGAARDYRAITTGRALSSDVSQSFAYAGVNLECLSPVHLTGSRHPTTNDWTLAWTRRSRYDQWRDYVDAPLGEASESYEVDVYSDGTYATLKRTLAASSPSAAYTSAQQVADFGSNQATLYLKVYQLSATVGRGYALTQSLSR